MAKSKDYVDSLERRTRQKRDPKGGHDRAHARSKGRRAWTRIASINSEPLTTVQRRTLTTSPPLKSKSTRQHGTSLLACLCECVKSLCASSNSVEFSDARVEAGVEDEASAFNFKPAAEEGVYVLVAAAFQPEIRAMLYHEMLGHRFGIGPATEARS